MKDEEKGKEKEGLHYCVLVEKGIIAAISTTAKKLVFFTYPFPWKRL
jgi:hypothetical protein